MLTISAWVRVRAFQTAAHNISSIAGIEVWNGTTVTQSALLRLGDIGLGSNRPQFVLQLGNDQVKLDGATVLALGSWYHLAGVYDGTQMILYVNGQPDSQLSTIIGPDPNDGEAPPIVLGPLNANGPLHIGSSGLGADRTLLGRLDDVKVFKKALSAAEIAEVVTETTPLPAGKAIWPVKLLPTNPGDPARPGDEEHRMLSGFGDGVPFNLFKFHEGIDISASGTGGERVVAARAGRIMAVGPSSNGEQVTIKVAVPGVVGGYGYDNYLHLMGLVVPSGTWVSQGQTIGYIGTVYPIGSRHLHYDVTNLFVPLGATAPETSFLNPFLRFESHADRDPLGNNPVLTDTNGDRKDFFAIRNGTAWDLIEGTLDGDVDLVADIRDIMHSNEDYGSNPYSIGYYIRPLAPFKTVGVKTGPTTAYTLARFDDTWFPGSPKVKFSDVYADSGIVNLTNHTKLGDFRVNPNTTNAAHTKHYILTNTEGTNGSVANVDGGQFWNTNATEREIPFDMSEDGSSANHSGDSDAIDNADARFKDGNYVVHIVMSDVWMADIFQYEDQSYKVRVANFSRAAGAGKGTMLPPVAGTPVASDIFNDAPYNADFVPESAIAPVGGPTFNVGETVGIQGAQYYPNELMTAYVLPHKPGGWMEGEALAGAIFTAVVRSDDRGLVPLTSSGWVVPNSPAVPEDCDIIIDYNNDGLFTWKLDGLGSLRLNQTPDAVDDSAATNEDSSVLIDVLANDTAPNDDVLTIVSLGSPGHGSATIVGTLVRYTPNPNWNGTDSFSYTISDEDGETDTATVTVVVYPVNDPPTAVDDSGTLFEDGSGSVMVTFNDSSAPDGLETLTVASVTQGAHGSVSIDVGATSLRYTPQANYHGTDSFTYTLSDGNGGTATATVTMTVTSVNDTPFAANDTLVIDEDAGSSTIAVLQNDTDPDGEVLSVFSIGLPNHGTASLVNGAVTYTPHANYHGTDGFGYTLWDGSTGYAAGTIHITVNSVNDLPVAVADSATTMAGMGAYIFVTGNDTDVDSMMLSVSWHTSPASGTLSVSGGMVTYTPNLGFSGTDSFQYKVSDGLGESNNTATVTITVTSPPSPPPPPPPLSPPPPSGSASGWIWNDSNNNGLQDLGEIGFDGVTVKLFDGSNNLIATTTTMGGLYTFMSVTYGTYYVQVIAPSGYSFVEEHALDENEQSQPWWDSDVDSSGLSDEFAVGAGFTFVDLDIGFAM